MASQSTLMDFFAGPVMTELARGRGIKAGVPNFLPPALFTPSADKPTGVQIKYRYVAGQSGRQTADVVTPNSPAKRQEIEGSEWRYATALGTRESFVIEQPSLVALKSNIPLLAEGVKGEVVRQISDFRKRAENLKLNSIASLFGKGSIWVNFQGQLQTAATYVSGGTTYTNQAITPTTTRTTLVATTKVDGTAIGDFSSAAVDIAQGIRLIRSNSIRQYNYDINTCLYGRKVPSWMLNNTALQVYLSRNPSLNNQLLTTNEIPAGFLGIANWMPVGDQYFADTNNVVSSWFADNQMVFMPNPADADWYEYFDAGQLIPTGIGTPGMSMEQQIENCQIVNGPFAYTVFNSNPMSVEVITGQYGYPLIKAPQVVASYTPT